MRVLALIASGCGAAVAADGPALPDLPHGTCDSGASGADGYFVGKFTVADGKVTGTETWILYANALWKQHGGRDCSVTWAVSGAVAPHGTCATCALSIQFHATPDVAGSKCPPALLTGSISPDGKQVGGEAVPFDQLYDVATSPDGTAVVTFGKSGKELGRGHYTGGVLDYTSHHQCKFF